MTDLIEEISVASAEQSNGIDQVNEAVVQMDQVTQQNASLVQQASSAAASLNEQVQRLEQALAGFRIDGAESRPSTTAAPVVQARVQAQVQAPAPRLSAPRRPAMASTEEDWESF